MESMGRLSNTALRGRRIVVTGASGFIASHLVRRLVAAGSYVIACVRASSNLWRLHDVRDRIEIVHADMHQLDVDSLATLLAGVQDIYHLAAAGVNQATSEPATILQANVLGTLGWLRVAHRLNVDRFIYCGSCFEYGGGTMLHEDMLPVPTSEYAASKAAAWLLVHAFARRYGLPVVSLRPFTVYGPFEASYRLVPYTIIKALDGGEIALTGGEQTRDFIFIDDVIDAFVFAAVKNEAVGSTLNVCTGSETSVKDLVSTIVDLIVDLTGCRATPQFGARPYRDAEMWHLSGNPGRAQATLGWQAHTSLHDGLKATIAWMQTHRSMYG